MQLGLPVELQGGVEHPVDRIEPIELALVGLTDCIIATVAVHAVINGIDLDSNSSIVRAPVALQVFLGIDDLETRD